MSLKELFKKIKRGRGRVSERNSKDHKNGGLSVTLFVPNGFPKKIIEYKIR